MSYCRHPSETELRAIGRIIAPVVNRALDLRPIPTTWRGVTYRSRLEARWVAFFDIAGIVADYEDEALDLGGEAYLPDFHIRVWDLFVEVKPTDPTPTEIRRAGMLQSMSDELALIVVGPPKQARGWTLLPECAGLEPPHGAVPAFLARCRGCGAAQVTYRFRNGHGGLALEACADRPRCVDRWSHFGEGFEAAADGVAALNFSNRDPIESGR